MARRIELLGDIELRDMTHDTQILDKGQPVVWSHEKFLCSIPADPQFINGLTGIDATEMQYDARRQIRTQCAKQRGFVVVSEIQYQRMLDTVKHPQSQFPWQTNVSICFYDYARSVRDAKECDDDGNAKE